MLKTIKSSDLPPKDDNDKVVGGSGDKNLFKFKKNE